MEQAVIPAATESVSVPKAQLTAVLEYLLPERVQYEACPAEEREAGHIWQAVAALLPHVTLACTCNGVLCEGEWFRCGTCQRLVPNCRGAADQWPDDCDDCAAKKMEAAGE
jgi:hypothetical protein